MSAENIRDYYRNQGVQVERERIIKLIEENEYELTIIGADGFKYQLDDWLIALIKGETE